jgi:2-polyprenyl-6-methoxyphenol hydroxylase-like FAD-dependent oxidoreductase
MSARRSSRPICTTPTRGTPRPPKWSAPARYSRSPRERGSALSRPAEWFAGIDFTNATTAVARIAAEFEGWAPELTALITDGETAPVPRILHTLPIGHRWHRVPGVTLLGDAAHLAPPAGEGANLAMLDGAELGKAIAAHPHDIEAALADYEAALFPRSQSAAADAHEILKLCLGDRAPFGLVEFFTQTSASQTIS